MTDRTPQQEAHYLEKLGFTAANDTSATAEKAAQAFHAEFQDVMKTHSTQYLDQIGQTLRKDKTVDGVGIGTLFSGAPTLHFQDVSFWGGKLDSPTGPRVIDGNNANERQLPQIHAGQTADVKTGLYVAEKGSHVNGKAADTAGLLQIYAEEGSVVNVQGAAFEDAFKGSQSTVSHLAQAFAHDGSHVTVGDGGTSIAFADSHVTAQKGGVVFAESGSYIDAEAGSQIYAHKGAHVKLEKGATVKWD